MNQPSDIFYLADMRLGDHAVCLGPNSSMHTPTTNFVLFETGRVYPCAKGHPVGLHCQWAGCGLFNWRRASAAELAAHLGGRIADGHNPAGLTIQQVGDGWRLITPIELNARGVWRASTGTNITTHDIQMWNDSDKTWDIRSSVAGDNPQVTYRTKLSAAELAALIAPPVKRKVPLTPDDLPSVCWVRWTETPMAHYLITAMTPKAIAISPHHSNWLDWPYLMTSMEYSSDRKTWRGAYNEVSS